MSSLMMRWAGIPPSSRLTTSARNRTPGGVLHRMAATSTKAAARCEQQAAERSVVLVGRRPALLFALALAPAAIVPRPARAEEEAPPRPEELALAAEAAGDWKAAAEVWLALTNAAEGPGRRDKQTGAKLRFRYAMCLLELGEKRSAAKALEVSARVLRGSDVRAALAATLWAAGEGDKAEAFWQAAVDQGGSGVLTEEYTRDVLLWPPTVVDSLARFRAAEVPPTPDAEAEEDLAKFEQAKETKEFFREKLGIANSLEGVIFGGK